MKKQWMVVLAVALLALFATNALADEDTDEKLKDLRKRIQKLEVAESKDRVDFGGELRVEAHTITGEVPDYYNGMALQQVLVNSLFFHDNTGNLPLDPGTGGFDYNAVLGLIGDPDNYGAYMMFLNNLAFADVGTRMGAMLAEMVTMMGGDPSNPDHIAAARDAAMAGMLAVPGVFQEGYSTNNAILYTTRLRLDMKAEVSDQVDFVGRLAMYKPWGASTSVPVFNGQANTMAMDAGTPGVPASEVIRVERAFFTWKEIGGTPTYLSLGRRPSTGGPPLHFRNDEMRAGTPLGTIIDFQFDGATLGYNFGDHTVLRACYGLGYESQFGNGSLLKTPNDRLKDASFFGFNVDAWNSEEMQIQATVARAFNVTDGFNGYVIMPNNPVTGQPMPGPIVTRFTPSENLGEIDLASLLVTRRDGPVDYFASASLSSTRPEGNVTTPFGGLMADPFEVAESQTGTMFYLGARYNLSDEKTKIGVEYNQGSEYWFNFAASSDDIISPKTSTRGNVFEGYVTHRITKRFITKVGYIRYNFDYSGSGWHLGRPKDLNERQVLGFPTYTKADELTLSFMARF